MKKIVIDGGMHSDLMSWLQKNVGFIDEAWTLGFDNTLTFKHDKDATYFYMMFYEKIRNGIYYPRGIHKSTERVRYIYGYDPELDKRISNTGKGFVDIFLDWIKI